MTERKDITMPPQERSIWDKAVCLNFSLGKPSSRRSGDKSQIETDINKDSLSITKNVLNSPGYKNIEKLDRGMKSALSLLALPSVLLRSGIYPVPLDLVEQVSEQIDEFETERDKLVETFITYDYPKVVSDAPDDLKSQYRSTDYPPAEVLRKKFTVSRQWLSFDTPATLQSISKEFFAKEKERAASHFASAASDIEAALATAFGGLVGHLADQLKPKADGKLPRLHESVIKKLTDFLSTFDARNLTDDRELATVVDKARAILKGKDKTAITDAGSNFRTQLAGELSSIKESVDKMIDVRTRNVR